MNIFRIIIITIYFLDSQENVESVVMKATVMQLHRTAFGNAEDIAVGLNFFFFFSFYHEIWLKFKSVKQHKAASSFFQGHNRIMEVVFWSAIILIAFSINTGLLPGTQLAAIRTHCRWTDEALRRGKIAWRKNTNTKKTSPLGKLIFGTFIGARWGDLSCFSRAFSALSGAMYCRKGFFDFLYTCVPTASPLFTTVLAKLFNLSK